MRLIRRNSRPAPESEATPISISPRVRTIMLLLACLALVLVFRWSPSLLPLLLGGATLALVLSFPVRLLAHVLPRGVAIALVVAGVLLLAALALVTLLPLLIRQLTELLAASPQLAAEGEGWLIDFLRPLAERGLLPVEPSGVIADIRQGLLDRAQVLAQWLLGGVFEILTGTVGTFIQLFGVLFIAIYLLADIRRFAAAYLRAVPHRYPYVGAFLGAIPAVILALFISPWTALLAALAYLVINQLEGNILTPRIQGDAVKVHPLLVLLAVVAGGEIAGLLGSALAVPILAVLRVLFDFFAARLRVRQPVHVEPLPYGTSGLPAPVPAEPPDAT